MRPGLNVVFGVDTLLKEKDKVLFRWVVVVALIVAVVWCPVWHSESGSRRHWLVAGAVECVYSVIATLS